MAAIRRQIVLVFFGLTYLSSSGAWLWVNATGQALSGGAGPVHVLLPLLAGYALAFFALAIARFKHE